MRLSCDTEPVGEKSELKIVVRGLRDTNPPDALVASLEAMSPSDRLTSLIAFQTVWGRLLHDTNWKKRIAAAKAELKPTKTEYANIVYIAFHVAADLKAALERV